MLSNVVEKAQVKVEELNFMRRKNVLKYDEVMNEQRRVIYDQRQRILMGEDFGEQVREMVAELVEASVRGALEGVQYSEDWDLDSLFIGLKQLYHPALKKSDIDVEARHRRRGRRPRRRRRARAVRRARARSSARSRCAASSAPSCSRSSTARWKDHLLDMDYLQEGIHLRALGQRDPLVEYKGEGFDLFNDMLESVKTSTVTTLMKNSPEDLAMFTAITLDEPVVRAQLHERRRPDQPDVVHRRRHGRRRVPRDDDLADAPPPNVAAGGGGGATSTSTAPVQVQQRIVYDKVGRNDPCPCGSGKKYKKCHGA